MTPKQERFVQEYLIDLNATQAAIRAGYSAKTAAQSGERTLRNVEVAAAIRNRMNAKGKKAEMTADQVRAELARLASFDPRKLYDDEGNPIPITELDDDTAAAVVGFEASGEGKGRVLKYKVADKAKALDMLMRHHGQYNGDTSTRPVLNVFMDGRKPDAD